MSKGKRDIPYLATCGLFYFTTDEIQIEVNPMREEQRRKSN